MARRSISTTWQIYYHEDLDEVFWEKYETLWRDTDNNSSFRSRNYIKYLVNKENATKDKILFSCGWYNGNLICIWPFTLKDGILEWIASNEVDYAIALMDKNIPIGELQKGIELAINLEGVRHVRLKKIPQWHLVFNILSKVSSDLKHKSYFFPFWICPSIENNKGQHQQDALHKAIYEKNKRLKSYENKLRKKDGFKFEVTQCDGNLKEWAQEFCDLHEIRWNKTPTPSLYIDQNERLHFFNQLQQWHKDKVSIRFSIMLGDERLAMCVGLLGNDRLIYHKIVYSSLYSELRPALILIRLMINWLLNNRKEIQIFDFGLGDEPYKSRFSNTQNKVHNFYFSHTKYSIMRLKMYVEKVIRMNSFYQYYWNKLINKHLRPLSYNLKYEINKVARGGKNAKIFRPDKNDKRVLINGTDHNRKKPIMRSEAYEYIEINNVYDKLDRSFILEMTYNSKYETHLEGNSLLWYKKNSDALFCVVVVPPG